VKNEVTTQIGRAFQAKSPLESAQPTSIVAENATPNLR
jgi:hypothetical protein